MYKPAVLIVHNSYQQSGGEDVVVRQEAALLRAHGHRVVEYLCHNDQIRADDLWSKLKVGFGASWSAHAHRQICEVLRRETPDVMHCHNLLPLISPAVYYACRSAGVPVVQTIHNYRLFCPAGTFFRNSRICEDCRQGLWYSIRHRCYRDSRLGSASVAMMLKFHRLQQTWTRAVDAYIALTRFVRDKMVEAGLPAAKVMLKPNFLDPDPGARTGEDGYAVFAGRLTPEKGVRTLLEAWKLVPYPLVVIGDGPMHEEVRRNPQTNVTLAGRLPRSETLALIKRAKLLVFPSEWYECFPVTLVEAFACGVPVLASRLGSMAEIVEHGRTGLLFDAGNAEHLASQVRWAWVHPDQMATMGVNARQEYLSHYTAETNYRTLAAIYDRVLRVEQQNFSTSTQAAELSQ